MTIKAYYPWRNGDQYVQIAWIACDTCGREFPENFPHTVSGEENEFHLCLDCSYICGKFTKQQYLGLSGVSLKNADVVMIDGSLKISVGRRKRKKRKGKRSQGGE